jgi:MFS family permease
VTRWACATTLRNGEMSKPVDNPHLWITKRLPAAVISRAISLVFSGNSIAAIVAVPLGSYLGGVYGWRVIYLLAAVFGIITLALQSGSARLSGRRPEGRASGCARPIEDPACARGVDQTIPRDASSMPASPATGSLSSIPTWRNRI